MLRFSQTADRIRATTKKLQKAAILADYLKSLPPEEAAVAAVFFCGRPFPVWEETTLQVGGSQLWRIVAELSEKSENELTDAYRRHGDLGAVAETVLPNQGSRRPQVVLEDAPHSPVAFAQEDRGPYPPTRVQRIFREISSARGPAAKGFLLRPLLGAISPLEAKYIIKIVTGDLRIGVKESLVEEAIAKAFDAPPKRAEPKDVQRANMLLGDIGETLKLAAEGRLAEAKMRLFHPIGFMLASPADSAEDALSYFSNARVEDKYDGIRAQAHCAGDAVRFFSRTRDEITESFPELPGALGGLPHDAILDGEIVAWSFLSDAEPRDESTTFAPATGERPAAPSVTGRALPFSTLQRRLGRKKVSEKLTREVPVAYIVFDVLYANRELLIDRSLRDRAKILDNLLAQKTPTPQAGRESQENSKRVAEPQEELFFGASPRSRVPDAPERKPRSENGTPATKSEPPIATLQAMLDAPRPSLIRAPGCDARSPEELNALFDAAQARGNEGLMIKDPASSYTPGRRGKSWLKLKRELATLDVVVTAVEYGHGRRIGVLSDYTFAVRDGDRLLNVGKAYSGLTDAEILEMTNWFLDHTIEDQGFRRLVDPKIVLEVAFNNVMKSDRHASGYALRFPRIVRLRPDKLPEEADMLETVKNVYAKQSR
jgi:DNA ligase-1